MNEVKVVVKEQRRMDRNKVIGWKGFHCDKP